MMLACVAAAAIGAQASPPHAAQASGNASQASGDAPRPVATTFRSGVDIVALHVVVTDRKQGFVSGLERSDFVVREDGVPQDVSFFATTDVPLDLALLLDTSASMSDRMPDVRSAARGFVQAVRGIDRVMVLDIKQSIRTLHPLNGDVARALEAIDTTEPSGGTGLYNGLYVALKELQTARTSDDAGRVRRQAIVVLSDGYDTSSLLSFDDVMEIASNAGIATYTINLQSTASRVGQPVAASRVLTSAEYSLKELARATGAEAFFPDDVKDLSGVYGRIATELASQYALAYVPKKGRQDGTFRRISVEVPDRPGSRARTRAGYVSRRHDGV